MFGVHKNFDYSKISKLFQYWMLLFDFLLTLIKPFYDATISLNVVFRKNKQTK